MNTVFNLYRLQKIDIQIDGISARIKQITQTIEGDQSVQNATNSLHDALVIVEHCHHSLRFHEEELRSLQIKKETDEASLYGGKIQNPKELRGIQDEIDSLKRRISTLEDKILDTMAQSENAEHDHQVAEKNVTQAQDDFIQTKASLLGEQNQLLRQKENLESERQPIVSSIPGNLIENYNLLRKQKRGIAVTSNEDGACSACGTTLRAEEIQASRSPNQVIYCSSCGRILYSG